MSILNNNKKGAGKQADKTKTNNNNSKFIKGSGSSKSPNVTKKVRSTGANRGS